MKPFPIDRYPIPADEESAQKQTVGKINKSGHETYHDIRDNTGYESNNRGARPKRCVDYEAVVEETP